MRENVFKQLCSLEDLNDNHETGRGDAESSMIHVHVGFSSNHVFSRSSGFGHSATSDLLSLSLSPIAFSNLVSMAHGISDTMTLTAVLAFGDGVVEVRALVVDQAHVGTLASAFRCEHPRLYSLKILYSLN